MRILYIHQYFCTRAGRSGTRSYEFARNLVRRGHQVTMLTSDSALSDIRLPEGSKRAEMNVEGIDVIVVRASYSQSLGSLGRIRSFLLFMLRSSWVACRLPRHDVVIATSTPLTVGVPGLLVAWLRRTPLVFEVRDLWPEAPIQMGVIRNPVVVRLLRGFERLVYRHSAQVIALSPGMRDGIRAVGTPAGKITVIPNCSDLDLFHPAPTVPEVKRQYGLEEHFVAAHIGSIGPINGISTVIDAAHDLQSRGASHIRILLVGQGKQEEDIRRRVLELGLRNVVFAGVMPRSDLSRVFLAVDVCLVTVGHVPILSTASPNKLFDALAAGRAIVVNSDGWMRELVEQHEVGVYASPGSGAALAEQILWLSTHDDAVRGMGANARRLAEERFDRIKLVEQFERVLFVAAEGAGGVAAERRPTSPDPLPSEVREPESGCDPAVAGMTAGVGSFDSDTRC